MLFQIVTQDGTGHGPETNARWRQRPRRMISLGLPKNHDELISPATSERKSNRQEACSLDMEKGRQGNSSGHVPETNVGGDSGHAG